MPRAEGEVRRFGSTLNRRALLRRTAGLGLAATGLGAGGACGRSRRADELVFGFSGDTVGIEAYQKVAELYRRKNPSVQLRVTYADSLGFFQRLPLMFRAGTAPDVMIVAESWVSGLSQLGGYDDLSAYVDQAGLGPETWVPSALKPGQIDGQTLCVPCVVFPKGIAYNRTLMEERGVPIPEPGWSEAEFVRAAAAISHGSGARRIWGVRNSFGTSLPYDVPTIHGGLPFDPKTRRMTATDPRVVSSLQLLSDLVHQHLAMPSGAQAQDTVDFTSGRYGMDLFAGYFLTAWTDQIGSRFDWGVVPQPAEWVGTYQNTNAAIFEGSRQKDAAWDLARFVATDPEAQAVLGALGTPAARPAARVWQGQLPKRSRAYPWGQLLERMGKQLVAFQGGLFNKVWDSLGQQVQAVENNGKPVPAALREVQERGTEILRA